MKKSILFLFLLLGLVDNAIAQVQPTDSDGDGFINISTLEHLRWVSENSESWDDNFELDNDINAAATETWNDSLGFMPIGNTVLGFTGKFDGNGFRIDSLYIKRPKDNYVGLFGWTTEAEISNIGVTNCQVIGMWCAGGIVGYSSSSELKSCYSTGRITASSYAGGLVGENHFSMAINCYSSSNISGSKYIGGLVGRNGFSMTINCYSSGIIWGYDYIGGLVGENDDSMASNCYCTGSVIGSQCSGGLIGRNFRSTVSNCYSTGRVTGSYYVGGLLGANEYSRVLNSFWDTITSGQTTSEYDIGKTTAEMKTKSTFTSAGWNFNLVWDLDATINNGYPFINDRGISYPGIEPIDTDGDGYRNISSYSHIHWISVHDLSWDWKYELDNNIKADTTWLLSGEIGFTPIGNSLKSFTGQFNGNGFAIDSLYINRPETNNLGLFGRTTNAKISNVGVTNCKIIGLQSVGALVGKHDSSSIVNSYSTGKVVGRNKIGGLVGENFFSKIDQSHSTSNINSMSFGGGLVGDNSFSSTVSKSYSNGSIDCNGNGGGLVGSNSTYSTVSTCYSTGSVSGTATLGGLLGVNDNYSTVSNCYSIGDVTGSYQIGGLVGLNYYYSAVINCYSIGSVPDSSYVGGLLGANISSTVSNSFWNTQTSGQTSSEGGKGQTTAEMKTKSTFTSADWDFGKIWSIAAYYNNGYPNLDGKNGQSDIIEVCSANLIYPQPASNELFIRLKESLEASASIKLYDQAGQLVMLLATSANDGLIRLNTSTLSSGVYRLIIIINGKNYSENVVIAK